MINSQVYSSSNPVPLSKLLGCISFPFFSYNLTDSLFHYHSKSKILYFKIFSYKLTLQELRKNLNITNR